jgi:hypothetical protein
MSEMLDLIKLDEISYTSGEIGTMTVEPGSMLVLFGGFDSCGYQYNGSINCHIYILNTSNVAEEN